MFAPLPPPTPIVNTFIILVNTLNYSIYIFSTPKPGPSFQSPVWLAPVPVNFYTQGSPIYMPNDQHFTIPQASYAFNLLNIIFLIAYGDGTVTNSSSAEGTGTVHKRCSCCLFGEFQRQVCNFAALLSKWISLTNTSIRSEN